MDVFWRLLGVAAIIFATLGGMAICMDAAGRNRRDKGDGS